jgi:hypothetical protein
VDILLTLLAATGIAAAIWHVVRAASRYLRVDAAGLRTDQAAPTHDGRGDAAGIEEARRERESAGTRRTRFGAEAVGWIILLLVPPLTPWGRHIYAVYTLLWFVPTLRRRRR